MVRRLNGFVRFTERLLISILLLPRFSCIASSALQATAGPHSILQSTSLFGAISGLTEPTARSSTGNASTSQENKSFENAAPLERVSGDERGQMSKAKAPEDRWGTVEQNGTLTSETENQTTVSASDLKSSPTHQIHTVSGSKFRSEGSEVEVEVKVNPFSNPTLKFDSQQTTDSPPSNCCNAVTNDQSATPPPDVYNYNEYDDDDDDDDDDNDDDEDDNDKNEGDETETDVNYEKSADGYNESSDDDQVIGDYREVDVEDDSEAEAGGGDAMNTEYIYVTDNVTRNESEISSDQDQQKSNPDHSYYYSQGADDAEWRASGPSDHMDNGQSFRGGGRGGGDPAEYESGVRDYHLGTMHHSFDLHAGQRISEMRSGIYHGRQSISLRWLEHHPINHFAIFLWLVAALALAGIAITAYRFRHSVVKVIQSTRANYRQGRRTGVEETNDLLSHAQV